MAIESWLRIAGIYYQLQVIEKDDGLFSQEVCLFPKSKEKIHLIPVSPLSCQFSTPHPFSLHVSRTLSRILAMR